MDRHLLAFDRAAGGSPADAAEGIRKQAWSLSSFKSYVNVFGTTHGGAGSSARGSVQDRTAALGAAGADGPAVLALAEALFDVAEAERQLADKLDALAEQQTMAAAAADLGLAGPPDAETAAALHRSLQALGDELNGRCALAHATGLKALAQARANLPADAAARLVGLQKLQPTTLPLAGQAAALIAEREQAVRQAAERLKGIEGNGDKARDAAIDGWSAMLRPPFKLSAVGLERAAARVPDEYASHYRPTAADPPSVVIAKARAARADLRYDVAVACYFGYAALFAPTDPAAEEYARAGAQYAFQFQRLGRRNGLYLSALNDGPARDGGLQVGDILTGYDGKSTGTAEELNDVLKASVTGEPVAVEFLRRDDEGRFRPQTTTLPKGGTTGAAFLPI